MKPFPVEDVGRLKMLIFKNNDEEEEYSVARYQDFNLQFLNGQLCLVCDIPSYHYRIVLPLANWRTIKKLYEQYRNSRNT